jgi:CheY-like chemotaxis protein
MTTPATNSSVTTPQAATPQKPWKVMLIDQSADFAAQFKSMLYDNSRFEVVEWVNSGTGWITNWRSAKPDFLFVSHELPKRDGIFVIEKIRSLDSNIHIVFMHNYVGSYANSMELKALSVGAAVVLQRPFSEKRFQVTLNRLAFLKGKTLNIKRLKFG